MPFEGWNHVSLHARSYDDSSPAHSQYSVVDSLTDSLAMHLILDCAPNSRGQVNYVILQLVAEKSDDGHDSQHRPR